MANSKFYFPLVAVLSLGLAASFNGCNCEAKVGGGTAKAPAPPKAPEPPKAATPPPPAPVAPPPAPRIKAVGKAKIEGNSIKMPGEVKFDLDKAVIKETDKETKEVLDTLLQLMKENAGISKLRIEGHTDNSGKDDHNLTLSQARAQAVVDWLIKNGIDKARFHALGFGSKCPVADNATKEGQAKNRRTAFELEEYEGKAVPEKDACSASSGSAAPAAAPATSASASPTK